MPIARIFDSEGNDFVGLAEPGMVGAPALRRQIDSDLNMPVGREFNGIGKQVL